MSCLSPKSAWQLKNSTGKPRFTLPQNLAHFDYLQLPCGTCAACKMRRASDWTTRLIAESYYYDDGFNCSFVTLTYDDNHLPPNSSLRYRDLQLFIKRLRRRLGDTQIRYFATGEYGSRTYRPHYHLIIFGYNFPDKKFMCKRGDNVLCRSDFLESLWSFGISSVAECSPATIAYVSRYCVKGLDFDISQFDTDLPVSARRSRERHLMSTKPPLGQAFFDDYFDDFVKDDCVIMGNHKRHVPRLFDRMLKSRDPDKFESVKLRRRAAAKNNSVDDRFSPMLSDAPKFNFHRNLKKFKREL